MDELAGRRSHMRSRSLRACRCVLSWVVARRLVPHYIGVARAD